MVRLLTSAFLFLSLPTVANDTLYRTDWGPGAQTCAKFVQQSEGNAESMIVYEIYTQGLTMGVLQMAQKLVRDNSSLLQPEVVQAILLKYCRANPEQTFTNAAFKFAGMALREAESVNP